MFSSATASIHQPQLLALRKMRILRFQLRLKLLVQPIFLGYSLLATVAHGAGLLKSIIFA
jgi:hypothetical protein